MPPRSFPQNEYVPPPGATRVLLVRHGQSMPFTEGEPFPLVDGHGDPPLSERGLWQAEQVGAALASEPIDAMYASSLQRTQQTAAPLAGRLGQSVTIEHDLREVFLGDFEGGLFRKHAADGHPAVEAMRSDREWGMIPGAESNLELTERVIGALHRIAGNHPDQYVAAFCHGGVIAAALGHAFEVNSFRFAGARNASFSHVVISDDGWIVRSFNEASHIGTQQADHNPAGSDHDRSTNRD